MSLCDDTNIYDKKIGITLKTYVISTIFVTQNIDDAVNNILNIQYIVVN